MDIFSIVAWTFAASFRLGYSYRARAEAAAGRIKSREELLGGDARHDGGIEATPAIRRARDQAHLFGRFQQWIRGVSVCAD
jgi:hypothetical protein